MAKAWFPLYGRSGRAHHWRDFYMWREILDHCKKLAKPNGFIFVTEERKPDLWESQQSDKVIRRIDPRIQGEVINEIGGPMLVVSFDEFIEFTTADADERKLLVDISEDARSSTSSNAPWTASAYLALLEWLAERGYEGQRDVVITAARGGGYIAREQIGEVLGWGGENRYLTRFRVPVDRAKRDLVDLEVLGEEASDPLWAVYEGPGGAIGYAVFNDFVQFQSDLDVDGGSPGN